MAKPDASPQPQRSARSPGYCTCGLAAGVESRRGRKTPRERARQQTPDHLVLLAGDRYVATARERLVRFYRYADLPGDGSDARPMAEVTASAPVVSLASRPGDGRVAVVAALADRSVVELELPEAGSGGRYEAKPRTRILIEDVGGELRHLIAMRRTVLGVVDERDAAGPTLVAVDARGGAVRRARLPLANLTSVAALDAHRSDLLIAVDARHGAHLAGFPVDVDGSTLRVTPFDPEARVTAATGLDDRTMVVARKGGELAKVRYTASVGGSAEATAEICRRLRHVLRLCGCDCHGHEPPGREPPCDCDRDPSGPGGGGPGRPPGGGGSGRPGRPGDGTGPGGTIVDDEPCDETHRASLGWTVARLYRVGHHVAAVASGGVRLAVLDRNLNVVFERYLGPRGALLAASTGATDRLLVLQRGKARLEAWSIDEYARVARAVDTPAPGRRRVDPAYAGTVTFRGRKSRPASSNPHLRVAVFTVTEPGQPFDDPDQSKMQALLEPNVYDIAYDYYRENSFYTLDTEFRVFGVHIGAARKPLVLPRPIASYFYDQFSPGGIEAVMPGDWTDPLALDGTEAVTLRSDPAFGVGKDYAIPFAALWTTRAHGSYPIDVSFAGTETLQIDVEDQTGTARTLNLAFAPLALSHAQGDDEAAFLQALGQHVTNAVRAAETAAGSPMVLQDVLFRRIRSSTNDAEFGRLQCQLRVAAAGGATQKGRITLVPPGTPPAPLVVLGLNGVGARSGVLGSRNQIVDYLAECLYAARFDAGEGVGLNDPHLDAMVEAEEDTAAGEVRVQIRLATAKGGAGARITLVSSSGLATSGWSAAVPIPGSESTANNTNAMRYHQELADDVFTAAMDHIRATSAWNAEAVRAQFADFDAMMIGFVGACPATVPIVDQWSSADAVDFSRLRMFVRYHQATDQNNPNPADLPVTMGTDLLIGQRFNQFDPGVMSHEIGHGLGLPDLYSATGFRDDVVYVDRWCQMGSGNSRFNHFCAWSKWAVGWIVEDPGDPTLNRVVEVPMPDPVGTTVTEAWLYPVEYWDGSIRADVEAEVGTGLPIGQVMKVHLGSDGGVVDLIELRAAGPSYSQQLPPTPAVIVTNVLQPGTDRRWAVNGLYRRSVHLLNEGRELRAVGDSWNFAAAPEFPLKGCTVELVDLRTIRGGTIPIGRLRVTREPAEFIDLYFQDNVPSWRSPDIWIDWPGDNADPAVPRVYPEGTPTDQGETVRFPSTGVERHFLVARPHNAGVVHAEDVKVRWFICDPPGAGDDGRWVQRDTMTIPQIAGDSWEITPFIWNVDPSTSSHQCLRAEIIDWTVPTGVDPATGDTLALASDDVLLQNNNAQQNVFDFEAAT